MTLLELTPVATPVAAFVGAYLGQRVNIGRAAAAGRAAALELLRELGLVDAERPALPADPAVHP